MITNSCRRRAYIDTAKGIGILLVMFSHLLSADKLWFAAPFLVGMFFVTAGYVYTPQEDFSRFFRQKARRLLRPYLFFNIFLVAFYAALNGSLLHEAAGVIYSRYSLYVVSYEGTNPVWLDAFNAPTWFLTALFLSLLLFRWLMSVSYKVQVVLILGYLAVAVGCTYLPVLLPWSIDSAPLYALLMFAGFWVKVNNRYMLQRWTAFSFLLKSGICTLLLSLYFAGTLYNGYVNLSVRIYGESLFLFYVTCILGTLFVLYLSRAFEHTVIGRGLAAIGRHSLTLFCSFSLFFSIFNCIISNLFGASIYSRGYLSLIPQTAVVFATVLCGMALSVVLKRLERH